MKRYPARTAAVVLAAALIAAATPLLARDWKGGRGDRDDHRYYDNRYDHNRYYPPRGYRVPALPPGHYSVRYRGNPYYYQGGVWYRPWGPRFVVVAPPVGVVIPFLPPFFTTVWFGGTPYYYADDVYYRWRPADHGYVVTSPPGPDSSVSVTQPDRDEVYVYPSRGQSEERQASDRYACYRWAAGQTGFDPTQPLGGVPSGQSASGRDDYQRAETACLEARGYSVR